MSSRRDEMLKEMGLVPIWSLRERASVPHVAAATGDMDSAVDTASSEEAGSISQAVAAPPPLRAGDERRAAIMRMDWTALKQVVGVCVDCALHAKRNKTVFGVGGENA